MIRSGKICKSTCTNDGIRNVDVSGRFKRARRPYDRHLLRVYDLFVLLIRALRSKLFLDVELLEVENPKKPKRKMIRIQFTKGFHLKYDVMSQQDLVMRMHAALATAWKKE